MFGCAVEPAPQCPGGLRIDESLPAIFTGQWNEYYERALVFMESGCYQAALTDLKRAVTLRPKDKRLARTYGIHYIDYFPHREIGLIHYLMHNHKKAKRELELSLNQEPSAKAFHYLDKVRIRLIRGKSKIDNPPQLYINSPGSGKIIHTNADPVVFSGRASDESFVSEIFIDKKPLYLDVSSRETEFEKTLKLKSGLHIIEIGAQNLLGLKTSRTITVFVDRSGPVIGIRFLEQKNGFLRMEGFLHDDSGIKNCYINNRPATVIKTAPNRFHFSSPSPKPGAPVLIKATDTLGNTTTAKLWENRANGPEKPLFAMNRFPETFPETGYGYPKKRDKEKTTSPVTLNLNRDANHLTVSSGHIYVSGRAKSANGLNEIRINDKTLPLQKETIAFFNQRIDLEPGSNTVVIRATDAAGNAVTRKQTVKRVVPDIYRLGHRFGIALYPFTNTGDFAKTGIFHDSLYKNLSGPKRFRVKLRGNLLKNRASKTPADTEELPLHSTMTGLIYQTKNGIEIVARLIDQRTTRIMAVKDAFIDTRTWKRKGIAPLVNILSHKFHNTFPLHDGGITGKKGDSFMVLNHRKEGIHMGWPLIVYRKTENDKNRNRESGKHHFTNPDILGTAYVNRLAKDSYGAKIDKGSETKIQTGDRVITR